MYWWCSKCGDKNVSFYLVYSDIQNLGQINVLFFVLFQVCPERLHL